MRLNSEIDLEITAVTNEGCGVGRADKMAVFVPHTVTGDVVRAKINKVGKNFLSAELIKIITPSKYRIKEKCSQCSECGGCAFWHIDYEKEREIKRGFVRDAFTRIGKLSVPVNEVVFGADEHYRNKAQYPVAENGKTGFYAKRSHKIIPCDDCLLQPVEFSKIQKLIELFVKQYGISVYNEKTGKGLLRHVYVRTSHAGDIMVVLVINGENLPHSNTLIQMLLSVFAEKLKSVMLNINREKTNVVLGYKEKVLYGQRFIEDTVCGVRLRVSPLSFSQVNHNMAEKLYSKAADYANPEGKTVIDLYCGTGALGLSLANRAKSVIGVEIVPDAIKDAEYNAEQNGIKNVRFICADAAKAAAKLRDEGIKSDVVIVDPPRKGCDREVLEIIANNFCPETLVYVSCDPATLARDCKILSELGYKVVEATPVDLFPRTTHIETAAHLVRTASMI